MYLRPMLAVFAPLSLGARRVYASITRVAWYASESIGSLWTPGTHISRISGQTITTVRPVASWNSW